MKQLAILISVCVAFIGCAHRVYESTAIEHRKDSTNVIEKTSNSTNNVESIRYVYIHDSINIQSKGDTVFFYKSKIIRDYKTEHKLRLKIDSLQSVIDNFELQKDTIFINNVNTPTEKSMNAFQRMFYSIGICAAIILAALIVIFILKTRLF